MAWIDDLIPLTNPVLIERHIARTQGAMWEVRQYLEVDGVPVPWTTGHTAVCQVRTRPGVLVTTFVCSFPSAGWFSMYLGGGVGGTDAIAPGNYLYDVDVYPTATTTKRLAFMAGNFSVTPQVTI